MNLPTEIPVRIVDIDGHPISHPPAYFATKEAGERLIEEMERLNIDRSDMQVLLHSLMQELNFAMLMLPRRSSR